MATSTTPQISWISNRKTLISSSQRCLPRGLWECGGLVTFSTVAAYASAGRADIVTIIDDLLWWIASTNNLGIQGAFRYRRGGTARKNAIGKRVVKSFRCEKVHGSFQRVCNNAMASIGDGITLCEGQSNRRSVPLAHFKMTTVADVMFLSHVRGVSTW